MGLKVAAVNRMLNHLAGNSATSGPITHASLHSGFPATSINEISGGSPAYARLALTFEAVAGTETPGSLDMSNSPTFDVPAGTTVAAVGFWTALTSGTIMADSDVVDEVYGGQGTYQLTDADIGVAFTS